jgi:hypothetical protein
MSRRRCRDMILRRSDGRPMCRPLYATSNATPPIIDGDTTVGSPSRSDGHTFIAGQTTAATSSEPSLRVAARRLPATSDDAAANGATRRSHCGQRPFRRRSVSFLTTE